MGFDDESSVVPLVSRRMEKVKAVKGADLLSYTLEVDSEPSICSAKPSETPTKRECGYMELRSVVDHVVLITLRGMVRVH